MLSTQEIAAMNQRFATASQENRETLQRMETALRSRHTPVALPGGNESHFIWSGRVQRHARQQVGGRVI
ncbi:MAG TPA: hypothetical protein VEW42_00690 [Candidatus Eisenbacteria bacterium]|nr:hypothetical protein [Candidatus Eisenbacteria bacterium]